jgi:hypothetical protein
MCMVVDVVCMICELFVLILKVVVLEYNQTLCLLLLQLYTFFCRSSMYTDSGI